jgi:tRNA1Val (adenine37-N6)-methyltransferase
MKPFRFKQFDIYHDKCAMKVGTDGVLLGAWCNVNDAGSVLDIGTGSGLIAIMLAQRNHGCFIDAVEIDSESYRQALECRKQSLEIKNCNASHIISGLLEAVQQNL